jgi:hypothetical protein
MIVICHSRTKSNDCWDPLLHCTPTPWGTPTPWAPPTGSGQGTRS